MPTYEYRCSNCGHEFEEFQSMKDIPLVSCPQCTHDSLFRVIGLGGGMIFKGTGFYLTDYKNNTSSSTTGTSDKKTEVAKSAPTAAEKKPASTSTDIPSKPSSDS